MIRVYATSIAVGGAGILLCGPSGSGKSDLALRLIDEGALLVADDQTELRFIDDSVRLSAPASIAGKIEVRGLGILEMPSAKSAPLFLVANLVAPRAVERYPETRTCCYFGREFPLLALAPFEASVTAKLRLALRHLADASPTIRVASP
jgi:serine kinase of HPr protein (carbohydrate metabolism regulator)